jgi:hypothetical protein
MEIKPVQRLFLLLPGTRQSGAFGREAAAKRRKNLPNFFDHAKQLATGALQNNLGAPSRKKRQSLGLGPVLTALKAVSPKILTSLRSISMRFATLDVDAQQRALNALPK